VPTASNVDRSDRSITGCRQCAPLGKLRTTPQVQGGGNDQKLIVKSVVHMALGSAREQRADGSVACNAQGLNWFQRLSQAPLEASWARRKRDISQCRVRFRPRLIQPTSAIVMSGKTSNAATLTDPFSRMP
jgi:hypothetical protein